MKTHLSDDEDLDYEPQFEHFESYDGEESETDSTPEYKPKPAGIVLPRRKLIQLGAVIMVFAVLIVGTLGVSYILFGDDKAAPSDNNNNNNNNNDDGSVKENTNMKDFDINDRYYDSVERHPFTEHDLVRCNRVSPAVVSPDQNILAYTLYVYNPETNVSSTTLWIHNLERNETYRLTPFGWGVRESQPCFSLTSRQLIFVSNRDPDNPYYPGNSTQIWQINIEKANEQGTLPKRISQYPVDVNELLCSSTRKFLAIGVNVIPGMSMQDTNEVVTQKMNQNTRAFTYEKLMIRHWGDWFVGLRSHVFIQRIVWESDSLCTLLDEPKDLLGAIDSDVPTKPYGDISEWAFSPNDDEFSFTRRYDETSAAAWTTNLDIFSVGLSENGPVGDAKAITSTNLAADTQPVYSPDGTHIAYLAQSVPGYESDQNRIKVKNRNTGVVTTLLGGWMYSVDSLAWLPDSSGIFFTCLRNVRSQILHCESITDCNIPSPVTGSENVISGSVTVLSPGTYIGSIDSIHAPADIHLFNYTRGWQPITRVNQKQMDKVILNHGTQFFLNGADDESVHAIVLNATGTIQGRTNNGKFPVAMLIHGGPQSAWTDSWSYRWNAQVFAGHGYVPLMINFHGSEGYGQPFVDSIINDYGGKPFEDIMLGLDEFLASEVNTFADADSVVALGASYGGWMINWINGHPWNGQRKFKALVCHDGIFDQRDLYFGTEELWFPEHDMEGTPFTNGTNYDRWNPALFADQWATPELVIHGGRDYRIPDTHGIGAFTALQRQGIPSKFVYFPNENHWVLSPANSLYWHRAVFDWIDSYTRDS